MASFVTSTYPLGPPPPSRMCRAGETMGPARTFGAVTAGWDRNGLGGHDHQCPVADGIWSLSLSLSSFTTGLLTRRTFGGCYYAVPGLGPPG